MPNELDKLVEEIEALPETERQAKIDEVAKVFGEQSKESLNEVIARRKELKRLDEKAPVTPAIETPTVPVEPTTPVSPVPPVPTQTDPGLQRLREENKLTAKNNVLGPLGITDPAEVAEVEAKFKALDDGAINVPYIEKTWKSAAAAAFPDKFAQAAQKLEEMKQNADDFMQQQASVTTAPGESGDGSAPISKGAKDLMSDAKKQGLSISREAAERIEKDGMRRVYR